MKHPRNTNAKPVTSYQGLPLVSSDSAKFHTPTFDHHRNDRGQTNEIFIPSFLTIQSNCHNGILIPNTLMLPLFISDGMAIHHYYDHSDSRGHVTSQEHQIQKSPHEPKNESFITGGDPHLADLWHEIDSFDYEAFIESIENNFNVQQIQTTQEHEFLCDLKPVSCFIKPNYIIVITRSFPSRYSF